MPDSRDLDSPGGNNSQKDSLGFNDQTPILSAQQSSMNGDDLRRVFATDTPDDGDKLSKSDRYKQWMKSGLGISMALTSGCAFAVGYMFAALALMTLLPFQTVFIVQGMIGLIMIPPIIYLRIDFLMSTARQRLLLIGNGIGYTVGEAGLYFALSHLPIGNVNAIFMGSLPIITAILSTIFLREPWKLIHAFVAVVNITGIMLISQPTFLFGGEAYESTANETMNVKAFGYLTTIAGATGYAASYITCRALGEGVSMLTIILWDSIIAGIMCSTLTFLTESPKWSMNGRLFGFVVGIAIFDCLGHWTAFRSVQLENAATASLLFNFEVVVSYTLDYFVFGTHIGWFEIGGVLLILFSASVISVVTWKANQNKQFLDDAENAEKNGYIEFKSEN
ncbi:solute carrier family 35 member G1-like [Saccoglossus kowalevskii]|uniref:Solute carrier family 35 member G1-like n=1 Tax=Saccoglossus kowalevskii TaxID=10224 RepID=A0ABM0M5Y2_SACKO|nr:PREDICTED: solute carrier family 35 member G1-like [Saccoglossus kowalevskii]